MAIVETQQSVLNELANFLTGGIYSPMQITVTCAAGANGATSGQNVVKAGDDKRAALVEAAKRSLETGQPIYVQL